MAKAFYHEGPKAGESEAERQKRIKRNHRKRTVWELERLKEEVAKER